MNLDLFSFYVTFGLAVLYFCVFEVLPCEILCLMFEYHTILDGESDFFIGNTIYRILIGHVLLKIGNLKFTTFRKWKLRPNAEHGILLPVSLPLCPMYVFQMFGNVNSIL